MQTEEPQNNGYKANLKKFEELISKMRNCEKYRNYWNLNCANFQSKTIRENLCKICTLIKPERASHCKTCRRCIKKIDHHCAVVNNCVGLNNYKVFINMLIYSILTILFVIVTLIENIKFYLIEFSITYFTCVYIFIIIAMVSIECLLVYFFVFHMGVIFQGITQYEHTFKFHVYDPEYYTKFMNKTKWEKFIDVFGDNTFYWFLPTSKYFFKINIFDIIVF